MRVAGLPGSTDSPRWISAASGLLQLGTQLYVVADDERFLAVFDLADDGPGRLLPLFDVPLPDDPAARKASKPDAEALLALPPLAGWPHGALMAWGSASRATRRRAACMALDASGQPTGPAQQRDMLPLLAGLQGRVDDINIEGAFIQGDLLCLLQRGHGGGGVNACLQWHWPAVAAWLGGTAPAPPALACQVWDLGAIDGVPLSFTDGAALPGGGWLYSAAAEDTRDSYADGPCAGSVLGVVDAQGRPGPRWRLAPRCKVEGVAVSADAAGLQALLVTDADDRSQPAQLLSVRLPLA